MTEVNKYKRALLLKVVNYIEIKLFDEHKKEYEQSWLYWYDKWLDTMRH